MMTIHEARAKVPSRRAGLCNEPAGVIGRGLNLRSLLRRVAFALQILLDLADECGCPL
jgi:hypothetical protein